jgi:hypothetical protein
MQLETFQYIENKGWSIDTFPDLDSEQTLILVFAAPEFINHPEPIQELHNAFPKSKMIGCSSAGEIFGSTISDSSLAIAVIRFQNTKILITKVPIDNVKDSFTVGQQIIELLSDKELKNIFVLSDGLNVNGTQLVAGLNKSNPEIIITGGLAGDGSRFSETWSIYNGAILKNHVVAVGFYGNNIHIGHGSQGGWDVFGIERIVTRSKDNILYELDNRPALALYKEYLGSRAAELPATGLLYPLAIFAGDIPEGYLAQLMRANFERIITGAFNAGESAISTLFEEKKAVTSGPILCIAISCIGRRLLLGMRTEEEIESVLESLPDKTKQIGFYSYGEISPHSSRDCDLHNQTMTLTLMFEEIK